MNKQEAIEKIKNIDTLNINDKIAGQQVDMVIKNQVLSLIEQIDEPQKPVIPKFVAEWIDAIEGHGLFGLNYDYVDQSVWDWVTELGIDTDKLTIVEKSEKFYENYDCNVKKLHLAWLYGYTVEKEKLYTVEIPDPHGIYKIRYLFRNGMGNIRIGGGDYRDIFLNAETHLTESEIKQDFKWAWDAGFAKEVEEDETK